MKSDGYVNLIVVIISQFIHILKHHVIHLKYIQFLFVPPSPPKPTMRLLTHYETINISGPWTAAHAYSQEAGAVKVSLQILLT